VSTRGAYDVVIIGGGHNGLVCACYLARAGLRVRVFERRPVLGGAVVTEEFFPGFRNSVASYTVSLLHPKIIRDLCLEHHGLRIVQRPFANFLPLPDDRYLKVGGSLAATQAQFSRFSPKDAERLPGYYRMLARVGDELRALALATPPNVGGGLRNLVRALQVGVRLTRLPMSVRRDLLALLTKSVGDLLDTWFETPAVKAAFGFDAVVGNFAHPYQAGTAYVLLHHVLGEVNGNRGAWGHALGGMGAITQAMAREAARLGVELTTEAPVAGVRVKNGAVTGVTLANGAEFEAPRVVANVNPKLLYLELVDAAELDEEFLSRVRSYKCVSASLRMNVALSELPSFRCLAGTQSQPHHRSGIIIGPSLGYFESAYADARQFGWSRAPIVEMFIASAVDDSLAPAGAHVASLFCQHFNPVLPAERGWDEVKDQVADLVIDTVDRFAPNFKRSVLARQVLSPLDLEREFGLVGGDIFHGTLSLDQLYSARPFLGYADYRAPIRGLYLCGAGAHPGGGVSGLPGHNAAREIVRDARRGLRFRQRR
jgi:phytoene dehydrogenase-like protein